MSGILARKEAVIGLFIIFLLVGFGGGYLVGSVMAPAAPKPGLSGDVTIVFLCPLTGDLKTYGENSKATAELAASEVNEWLEARGEAWRLDLVVEDTATDPTTALSKLQTWHGKGVQFFVGPMSSNEVKELKSYADSNKILIVSPSSTSPGLSIAGDFIFRFCPDDTIQGPAIARLIWEAGVRHVVCTWREDAWGTGLKDATKAAFENLGGTFHEEVGYDPGLKDFPTQAEALKNAVEGLINQGVPKEQIGILAISFEEIIPYMEDASAYPVLKEVKWFGSDGTCLLSKLVEHEAAAPFAAQVNFTNTIFAPGVSPKFEAVKSHVEEVLGRSPDSYAYATYDIVWCLALALDIVDEYNAEKVRDVLPMVVKNYFGASGWFELNENGDRAFADYNLWTVMYNSTAEEYQWVMVGVYRGAEDKIEWFIQIYG